MDLIIGMARWGDSSPLVSWDTVSAVSLPIMSLLQFFGSAAMFVYDEEGKAFAAYWMATIFGMALGLLYFVRAIKAHNRALDRETVQESEWDPDGLMIRQQDPNAMFAEDPTFKLRHAHGFYYHPNMFD